jgi:hypothetical protein
MSYIYHLCPIFKLIVNVLKLQTCYTRHVVFIHLPSIFWFILKCIFNKPLIMIIPQDNGVLAPHNNYKPKYDFMNILYKQ